MKSTSLKIGLDYHGVIDQHPAYFARFCQEAVSRGHKIYIITGGPSKDVKAKLDKFNNPYNEIFAIVDFYEQKGEAILLSDGTYKISDDLWNKAKGEYCRQENIDIHIDDSAEYIKWFTTPYCKYNKNSNICQINNNQTINFSASPAEALTKIEEFLFY